MTTFVNLVPTQSRKLSDPGKRALYVHGSLYVHPYVFGSCRGQGSSSPSVSLVRLLYSDYTTYDTVTVSVSGVNAVLINAIAYARGKIWFALDNLDSDGTHQRATIWSVDTVTMEVTAYDYMYSGGVAPFILATVFPFTRPQIDSEIVVSDGRYVFFSSQYTHDYGSGLQAYGMLIRLDLNDMTLSYLDMHNIYADHTQPHSAVLDATHLYISTGTGDPGSGAGYIHYLVKIRLSDFTYVSRVQIPKATDDMTQSTDFVFVGYEANLRPAMFGYGVGAIAIRKSDMTVYYLPPLGPEDNGTVTSYASLVFGTHLIELKTNSHLYAIDLSIDPSTWNTGITDLSSIVVLDGTWDLTATPLYKNAGYQAFQFPPGNSKIPNELLADVQGKIHCFCWTRGNPNVVDSEATNDLTSGVVRATVPGITFVTVPIVETIVPVVSVTETVLHGSILDNGGSLILDAGFYLDTVNPPAAKVSVIGASLGPYQYITSSLTTGVTYYYRAYAANGLTEGVGEIMSFVAGVARGFRGTVRLDGAVDPGATVFAIDATTRMVVASQDVGSNGQYNMGNVDFPQIVEGHEYHLFAVHLLGNKYRTRVKAFRDVQTLT